MKGCTKSVLSAVGTVKARAPARHSESKSRRNLPTMFFITRCLEII
ncbi:hypothetical protein LINPERHAP1_LOCUS19150 [Linum perenne]